MFTVSCCMLRGLFSMRDSVSRSSTRLCIRRDCSSISARNWRRVASSTSGMSDSVSRKPPTTVNGVRSSCDTLATKSRCTVCTRSSWVMSRDSSSLRVMSNGTSWIDSTRSSGVGLCRISGWL
ncbi:hypothetical protein D3C78_1245890 [compost metagenome]